MNRLIELLDSDVCTNLLAALLHTLWQAVVIAGILMLFLKRKAAQNSNVRYTAALTALTTILLCGLFTWAVLQYEPPATTEAPFKMHSAEEPVFVNTRTDAKAFAPDNSSDNSTRSNWRTWAIGAWLIGVAVMLLRAGHIMVGGARLRRQCRPLENEQILAILEQLRKSVGITRRIRVAISEHISVPGVVGCIWPTLLLPASMISGVPMDDLHAILAHELAHIRRYDYLVNFCQMVIEAIFFFNPAVWWISQQVRLEREACCDQAGIAATGQSVRYAEVLADWAHRLKGENIDIATPAIGFGKSNDKSGLIERVQRIVVAGHRPRLRVSWYVATITLILSVAILIGLWRGTTMTVALAGKLLTPQQRIDKISDIEQTHLTFAKKEYTEEDNITLSGHVTTIDGKPLHHKTTLTIYREGPGGGMTKSIGISDQENWPLSNDGTILLNEEYGIIWLQITSQGYAPVSAGPLQTEPGGKIKDLNFILDKGFQGTIKLVNKDHEPIRSAKLVGGYVVRPSSYSHSLKQTTDANGLVVIQHASQQPVTLKVTAQGYESETFSNLQLNPEHPVVLELTRAKETTGVILSEQTDQPIPGAAIKVLMIQNASSNFSHGPDEGKTLTISNDQGRFVLNTLRSDSRYVLTIEAEGFGHRILYDVLAGQNDLKVTLPNEYRIKGRVEGSLEKLKQKDGTYAIRYSFGISHDHHSSWASSEKAIVDIREGQGYFEITRLLGNRVSIGSGSYRKSLDIENDSLETLLIDLTDPATKDGQNYRQREIIVKFDTPEGSPAPQGTIMFKYIDPEFASNTYKNVDLVIEDGQGKLEIPTPGKVAYDNSGIAGYWFEEKSGIKIPYAIDPCTITIKAVPAGSIYGEVFEHDGSKAKNVLVGVAVVGKSPLMGESPFLNVEGKNSASNSDLDTRYVISPLPLDGTYAIVAHTKDFYQVSDPITLNDTQPIRQLNMTLEKGQAFEICVVDERGKPIPSAPVDMSFDLEKGHGFSRQPSYTDIEGKVRVERLNPNAPGVYRLTVKDVPGYRPVRKDVETFDGPTVIQLEKGYVVTGQVIDDKTGWPIPGVKVYAMAKDYRLREPTTWIDADKFTDANGRFTFSTMARIEYNLEIRSGNLADHRNPRTVIGGETKDIILRVNLDQWSKLKPRKPAER